MTSLSMWDVERDGGVKMGDFSPRASSILTGVDNVQVADLRKYHTHTQPRHTHTSPQHPGLNAGSIAAFTGRKGSALLSIPYRHSQRG